MPIVSTYIYLSVFGFRFDVQPRP